MPWTELPSASAIASVSALEWSVKRPPASIVTAPMSAAREIVVARLIATAVATFTPPPLVEALGVLLAPSVAVGVPRLSLRVVFAKSRCSVT